MIYHLIQDLSLSRIIDALTILIDDKHYNTQGPFMG